MPRSVFIILLVLLIEVVAVGILTSNNWLHDSIGDERDMVSNWLGRETSSDLVIKTNTYYQSLFVDTGLVKASYALIPTEEERQRSGAFTDFGRESLFPAAKERIDVMWAAIYQSIQRMTLFVLWTPYMLPLFIPAFIDGLSVRQIKKVSYGYASPVRYHTAYHFIVVLIAAIPFYLALPVAVTPLVIPLWAAAFSFAVMLMLTNLQKQI